MKVYTGVGSRETPKEICDIMEELGEVLADLGWGLWSGDAPGPDHSFFTGALKSNNISNTDTFIFIPWRGFNNVWDLSPYHVIPSSHNTILYEDAKKIAESVIPYWEKLKDSHKKLHTRNVYQILGPFLNHKSKKVLCWAEPIGDGFKVKGGTGTAVALARKYDITVLNFYYEEELEKVLKFIKEYKQIKLLGS